MELLDGEPRGPGLLTSAYLRCLIHPPAPGPWNMAVDEALMETARRGCVTLRFYGWSPGCLSFGRNQSAHGRYDGGRAAERGIDVVRRPTGGRSVFHWREITYSITAPSAAWGSLRRAYGRINEALAAGLRKLGVAAQVAGPGATGGSPRPTVRACFRDPLPGEVTAAGRKLVGSAQWRNAGVLLQHGSLLIHNDQAMVEELRIGAPRAAEVPAAALVDLLEPLPETDRVTRALASAFAAELELPLRPAELDSGERAAAEALMPRYRDDAWTWRR